MVTSDMIPTGWRQVRLSDLGEVNRGRSRHRPRYAEHLYGGPYPFIQTGDVRESGGRITSFKQTYSEAGLAQSRLWPAGTMCITIAANIAESAILSFPACFPDSVVGFVADESKCDVRFVEYMFRQLKRRLQQEATGSVQDNINLATLERLTFPVPPVTSQRTIADTLGAFDDKIELNRRMNETLEAMARAIFTSWFVNFDPVRAKADGRQPKGIPAQIADLFPDSFQDSPLGPIPEGWEVCSLGEQVTLDRGLSYKGKYLTENGTPMVNLKCVKPHGGFRRDAIKPYSGDYKPRHVVKAGDIVIANTDLTQARDILGCPAFVPVLDGQEAITSHHTYAVRFSSDSAIDRLFTYHLLLSQRMRDRCHGYATGTTVLAVKRDVITEYEFALPSRELLTAFTSMVEPMWGLRDQNEGESITLAKTRDSLLPKLLSGEIIT